MEQLCQGGVVSGSAGALPSKTTRGRAVAPRSRSRAATWSRRASRSDSPSQTTWKGEFASAAPARSVVEALARTGEEARRRIESSMMR